MPTDKQRRAFRRRLASMSDEKIRAKLHVWKPWKRELAEKELGRRQIAKKKSWRRELAEQVQLAPKERPKNTRPAVVAIALVAAAAIAVLTLLLRYLGVI